MTWYETPADQQREAAVVRRLALTLGDGGWTRLPDGCGADGVLLDRFGDPFRVVEVKCRNNASTRYPTLMIDADKVLRGLELAKSYGVRYMLVVQWTDLCGAIMPEGVLAVRTGGRYDRNDPADIDDVTDYPVSMFDVLWKGTP